MPRQGFALAALLLISVALRAAGIGNRPVWVDEAYSALLAWGAPGAILDSLARDANPPLYFLLLHPWIRIAGSSAIALRALSAIFGVAGVALVFAAARTHFPGRPRIAWIAAIAAATVPLNLYYAHQARMYTLCFAIGAASLWSLQRLLARRRASDAAVHGAILALGLYTHNFFVFLLPVAPLAALARERRALGLSTLAVLGSILVYLPWMPTALQQSRSGVDAWIRPFWTATPPAAALPRSLEVMGIGGAYPAHMQEMGALRLTVPIGAGWDAMRWAGALAVGVALAFGLIGGAEARRAPAGVAEHLLAPLVLAILASLLVRPVFLVGRHEMAVLPAFCLLVGSGIDRILDRSRAAAIGILAVWSTGAGLAFAGIVRAVPSDPELQLASALRQGTSEKDAAVLPGFLYPVIEYHSVRLGVPCRRIPFPPEIGEHPGWFDAARAIREAGTLSRQATDLSTALQATTGGGGSVLLIRSVRTPPPIQQRIEDALREHLGEPMVEGGPDVFLLTYAGAESAR